MRSREQPIIATFTRFWWGEPRNHEKGRQWGRALQVFNTIKEHPPIKGGLSSGEGLVDAVHDDIMKWIPETKKRAGHFIVEKPAVADKRLYVSESEFGRVLVVMDREGNSLSQFLREAWERGNMGSMTKNNPVTADRRSHFPLRADYQR